MSETGRSWVGAVGRTGLLRVLPSSWERCARSARGTSVMWSLRVKGLGKEVLVHCSLGSENTLPAPTGRLSALMNENRHGCAHLAYQTWTRNHTDSRSKANIWPHTKVKFGLAGWQPVKKHPATMRQLGRRCVAGTDTVEVQMGQGTATLSGGSPGAPRSGHVSTQLLGL